MFRIRSMLSSPIMGAVIGAVLCYLLAVGLRASLVPPAGAAELTPLQAHSVYVMAHGMTGLPLPEVAPQVHVTSPEALRAMACGERTTCPDIQGFTDAAGNVHVSAALDFSDPRAGAVLLHEYVHALQCAALGGPATTCPEWQRREAQAYAVQMRALSAAGYPTLQVQMAAQAIASYRCA